MLTLVSLGIMCGLLYHELHPELSVSDLLIAGSNPKGCRFTRFPRIDVAACPQHFLLLTCVFSCEDRPWPSCPPLVSSCWSLVSSFWIWEWVSPTWREVPSFRIEALSLLFWWSSSYWCWAPVVERQFLVRRHSRIVPGTPPRIILFQVMVVA